MAKRRRRSHRFHGRTPLHWAAKTGKPVIVRFFLMLGSRPNVQDEYGRTPLHRATRRGHLAAVKTLIAAGADPNIADNGGIRPLKEAI